MDLLSNMPDLMQGAGVPAPRRLPPAQRGAGAADDRREPACPRAAPPCWPRGPRRARHAGRRGQPGRHRVRDHPRPRARVPVVAHHRLRRRLLRRVHRRPGRRPGRLPPPGSAPRRRPQSRAASARTPAWTDSPPPGTSRRHGLTRREHMPMTDANLRERAAKVVPGGMYGHLNAALLGPGYPQFFVGGEGCRQCDADGREYVDLMCSWGPIVIGHRHPRWRPRPPRSSPRATASTAPARSGGARRADGRHHPAGRLGDVLQERHRRHHPGPDGRPGRHRPDARCSWPTAPTTGPTPGARPASRARRPTSAPT